LSEYLREIDVVVNGKQIPELMELSFHPEKGLTLGAAVPCYRIYGDPTVVKQYPGLIDAASLIGGTAIQGRASVGGNLCNSGPAGDSIPALIALVAAARIAGADAALRRRGRRRSGRPAGDGRSDRRSGRDRAGHRPANH